MFRCMYDMVVDVIGECRVLTFIPDLPTAGIPPRPPTSKRSPPTPHPAKRKKLRII